MDPDPQQLLFPPFRLDLLNACLWRGEQRIVLRPTPFAILRYLREHPDRLITKEELLEAIWPDTYVSATVLKGYIQQIRKALGDHPREPRFIETIQRRGYRFIARLSTPRPVLSPESRVLSVPPTPNPQSLSPRLVGRDEELAHLQAWCETAQRGTRQVVFVTGEAGIGKTALVEAFLERLLRHSHPDGHSGVWVTYGHCREHFGAGEAYQPVLEALARLCREPDGERCVAILKHYAPTWLGQMPWLLSVTEQEELQRRLMGTTRAQMLREMAEAIEALTTQMTLVLVLEDLHWSDRATLDFLASVAQRQEGARLLLIGTYRPGDVSVTGHPLLSVKRGLQVHGQCEELALRLLSQAAVSEYLTVRFPETLPPAEVGQLLYEQTEGNPLFLVSVVDDCIARGVMIQDAAGMRLRLEESALGAHVPDTLQQFVAQQIARLSVEEQLLLEAASISGRVFSAAALAAGVEQPSSSCERRCEDLARRGQFIRAWGSAEWPDGTLAGQYQFIHSLYRTVWNEQIPVGLRRQLHQKIGLRKEHAYGQRSGEIAAELAVHFEAGRDFARAVAYLSQAGRNAASRNAHREAVRLFSRGLRVLKQLAETPERDQHELSLQLDLGEQLIMTQGWGGAGRKKGKDQKAKVKSKEEGCYQYALQVVRRQI